MLVVGNRIPDGQIWVAPRERAAIPDLVSDGPALFLFFLFAWAKSQ